MTRKEHLEEYRKLVKRSELAADHLGDLFERGHDTSGDVQYAAASLQKTKPYQLGEIIYEHVVPLLFPFAKQSDIAALCGQTPEAVRTISIMGVRYTIEQTGSKNRKRRCRCSPEEKLARQVHHSM